MTVTTVSPELTGDYTLDLAHTRIGFSARHAMVTKVRGAFNEFEGHAHIDTAEPAKSTATIVIKAASIDTRNEQRDAHLRSNDFLDLATYPEITFASTKVEPQPGDVYRVTGDLTIRGVTKPVTFDLEFLGSGPGMGEGVVVAGFEARAEIDRRDFNVSFEGLMENGTLVVGNKVILEITVEVASQQK